MRSKEIKLSDGRTVEVRELPMGKFSNLLMAIKKLPDGIDLTNTASASEEAIGTKLMASIPGVLGSGWGNFMQSIVDSTSLTKKDLEENINLEDGVTIIEAMITVNNFPRVVKIIGQWFQTSKAAIKETTTAG